MGPRGRPAEADGASERNLANTSIPEGLSFERPILDIVHKIEELKNLSAATGMDLNGEVRPLEERCERLTREIFARLTPWEKVQLARHPQRPLTEDFITRIFEDFVELHGDRVYGDDKAVITGFGRIEGRKVLVVGHRKGKDTKGKLSCNFGCAHPEGYRKALHKMRLAARFKMPIVTLVRMPNQVGRPTCPRAVLACAYERGRRWGSWGPRWGEGGHPPCSRQDPPHAPP